MVLVAFKFAIQAPAAQVELWRANARDRQRRSRESKKKPQSASVTSDVTRDLGLEQDRNRTGQAKYREIDWPEVAQPGGGSRG